jgi:hypothetical protein
VPGLTRVGDVVAKAQATWRYFILQLETGEFDLGSEAAIKNLNLLQANPSGGQEKGMCSTL